ncbi:MAG TPA: hypothetical protein VGV87_01435 [Blastocatellia bacterium]|nr:hypothetical protein [Blastocatellia bacterium]
MDKGATHLSEDDIVRYRSRRMPPADLLAADAHLALCDPCHGRLIDWQKMSEKTGSAARAFDEAAQGEVTHLSYDQLAKLVDEELSDIDREIAESHLGLCSQCEIELNDLREVRSRMASPAKEYAPERKRASRARPPALWQRPAFRIPAQAAAALACAALLVILVSLPLRRETTRLRARVAELETNNEALKEKAAESERLQSEIAALRDEVGHLKQAAEGEALVALNDGPGRVTLDKSGNLSGLNAQPQYERAVREALQKERVNLPAAIAGSHSGTLMGGEYPEFKLLAPVGIVIETDRPTFRWSRLEGATGYTVTVYNSHLTRIATSDVVTANEWTATSALPRGGTCIWQVRAIKDGKEVVAPPPAGPKAKFRVLEQSKVDEIVRVKKDYSNSHLVMGVVYAEAGLREEAKREFAELLKANPQSPVARKILLSVSRTKR